MSGIKYMILGGGGSFAIHTALHLVEKQDTDKIVSVGRNLLREETFSLGLLKNKKISYHTYHLTYEQDLLLELIDREKPDYIINYAAQGEGAVSWKNSWRFFETNSVGLSKLVENLMKRKFLKNFIHIGTSEMYGSTSKPTNEDSPIMPSSPYAASKVAFDLYLKSINKNLGFNMNIVRPSNAYCSGQLLHRIIPRSFVSIVKNIKIPLHGGGRAEKSYMHAKDLAEAIYLIIKKGQIGEIYNVGPDKPTSIKEVVERVAAKFDKNLDEVVEITDDRVGQDSRYWLDTSKIKNTLGWKMKIDFDSGLDEVKDWVLKYKDDLIKRDFDYIMRG
tara:strand:- start:82 stop:1077 length:996 start_codon:yes stop_codon:yes gene_type:complete